MPFFQENKKNIELATDIAKEIKRQIKEKKYDIKSNNEFLDFLYSLDNEQLEQDFQSFLQKNNLSSHMLVFAKKKI